jgi:hypothetical protein
MSRSLIRLAREASRLPNTDIRVAQVIGSLTEALETALAKLAEANKKIDGMERSRRQVMLDAKAAPARRAAAAERQRRAEEHRLKALDPLSDRLAGVCFDEIERQGRVTVRAQLAQALRCELLRSGLWRDPRFPPPT